MKTLNAIIAILSVTEKHEFIQFLQQKNRRGDTKNTQLFKLLINEKHTNLDKKIYGKRNKNAFHALSKRLQDSLIDFIASKSFASETSEELEIMKLLLAARIFFEHKQYKIGFKSLSKAEKKAKELDLYSILNEIYHTKIQYAHHHTSEALSEIIKDSEKNSILFIKEQQLNMVYATIKAKLKIPGDKSINQIIIESFAFFNIQIDETLTYKSLFQLMNITATAAKLQSDYHTVSPFMLEAYAIITQKSDLAEKHLFYHLEILNLMALNSFRNKKFEDSKRFTQKLASKMEKRYTQRFQEKLTILQALNSNYTKSPNEAIATLKSFKGDSLHVDLTLVTCLFQQKEYHEAYKIIKNFSHTDSYYEKQVGWIWVLKKAMIELLLVMELDKLDTVLLKLQRFKRNFTLQLKKAGEERVLKFIDLISTYYENPKIVNSKDFKAKVENSFDWIGAEREDIFVMSFYAWLKAKMESRDTYEVTLELAHR